MAVMDNCCGCGDCGYRGLWAWQIHSGLPPFPLPLRGTYGGDADYADYTSPTDPDVAQFVNQFWTTYLGVGGAPITPDLTSHVVPGYAALYDYRETTHYTHVVLRFETVASYYDPGSPPTPPDTASLRTVWSQVTFDIDSRNNRVKYVKWESSLNGTIYEATQNDDGSVTSSGTADLSLFYTSGGITNYAHDWWSAAERTSLDSGATYSSTITDTSYSWRVDGYTGIFSGGGASKAVHTLFTMTVSTAYTIDDALADAVGMLADMNWGDNVTDQNHPLDTPAPIPFGEIWSYGWSLTWPIAKQFWSTTFANLDTTASCSHAYPIPTHPSAGLMIAEGGGPGDNNGSAVAWKSQFKLSGSTCLKAKEVTEFSPGTSALSPGCPGTDTSGGDWSKFSGSEDCGAFSTPDDPMEVAPTDIVFTYGWGEIYRGGCDALPDCCP
jgi:hypothetical protein